MKWIVLFLLALGLVMGQGQVVQAHNEPVAAEVTVSPSQPSAGQEAAVTVLLYGKLTQSPLLAAKIRLLGDMTAHRMTPVQVSLEPASRPGSYEGRVAFSMAGEWLVTLELEQLSDHDRIQFPLQVLANGNASGGEGQRLSFDVFQHSQGPLFSPWLAVAVALFLLVALLALSRLNDSSAAGQDN